MNTIKNKPLSVLTFTILNENENSDNKNSAYKELKRRTQNNGLNEKYILESDECVVSKRGQNINDYLISENPTGQLLMELYYKYVFNKLSGGDLLISETLLCNNKNVYGFFRKCLKLELMNIKERLNSEYVSWQEKDELWKHYCDLKKRLEYRPNCSVQWVENSSYDKFLELFDMSVLVSDELYAKSTDKLVQFEGKMGRPLSNSEATLFTLMLYPKTIISEVDFIDDLYAHYLISQESFRLNKQKRSIVRSLKHDKFIDYSKIR